MPQLTRNGMDTKADVLSFLPEHVHHLGNGVLGFRHTQTVAGDDDDVLGVLDQADGVVNVNLGVGAGDLHGLAAGGGSGSVTSQDHVGQGAVHGLKFDGITQ